MKRLVLADTHLSAYKDDPIEDLFGLPRRLSYIIHAIILSCETAKKYDIKNVDIAGDLHNDKDVIYTDSQNAFINHVILKYPDIHFTLLSGNHDLSSTGEFCSSCIAPYKAHANVTCVIDKPYIDGNVTFIPYTKDMKDMIVAAEPNGVLISHFGLSDAILQSGMSVVTNISCSDIQKFKICLLGHYHKPQSMYNRFFYVGNPVHINWNDKNEEKRFIIYDTETFKVDSVPLVGFFKQFKEFTITDKEQIKDILSNAKIEKDKGNIVKIRKKIKDDIENPDNVIILDDTEADFKNRGISMSMSDEEKFKSYIQLKSVGEDKKDKYLQIAKEIASACKI